MQTMRAEKYAQCTANLAKDHAAPGAEAVFDQALTNGLAAIVCAQWGEEHLMDGKKVKSAAQLLAVIEEKAEKATDEPGIYVIRETGMTASPSGGRPWPWAEDNEQTLPALNTRVDVAVLRDGISVTQAVRHARGAGGLTRGHVDALLALDDHESLQCLASEHADRAWTDSREADEHSQARAVATLIRIGDEEAARRAKQAVELHKPFHPKHNPDSLGLQSCPVCGYEAFGADHGDDHGMGVGVGECFVCHYQRSSEIAREEAEEMIYDLRWAEDGD
ncbi:hypothetical protein DEJ44_11395 [Streptomyces venezuelae]|uniref:hypothetical protein n=1 Tax=Streptomyces venezuelae TaxID=54571 RepID=UPI00123AE062|nr:hypothetical protein [Streptomyces venezuelae]QES06168.1 hypothetical protein DEJ44_11395 [Streptomyces venezuelae]